MLDCVASLLGVGFVEELEAYRVPMSRPSCLGEALYGGRNRREVKIWVFLGNFGLWTARVLSYTIAVYS